MVQFTKCNKAELDTGEYGGKTNQHKQKPKLYFVYNMKLKPQGTHFQN